MLWLILLFLVTLATADLRYLPKAPDLSNSRLPPLCGTPFAMTQENLDMFDSIVNGSINPAQDSSDIFGSLQAPQKWPRNEQNLVLIKYCFQSPFERQEIEPEFREFGIGRWMTALGGQASKQTGHGVAFEEALDRNGHLLFCKNPDGSWDPELDYNTVVIMKDENSAVGAYSTLGFVGFDSRIVQPGIHRVGMALHPSGFHAITHELGHLLGMTHEHQRRDRDTWVQYICQNVMGFDQAFQKMREVNPDAFEDDLCDSYIDTVQYKFRGDQFIRGWTTGDPRNPPHQIAPALPVTDHNYPYDVDSIMHYASWCYAKPEARCDQVDLSGCTILKRVQGGYEYIPTAFGPSAGDLQWIRTVYPWVDPPAGAAGAAGAGTGAGVEGVIGSNFTA